MSKKKKSASSAKATAREQLRAERERQQSREKRNARIFKIGVGVAIAAVVVSVVGVVQWQRSQISAASESGTPYPSTAAAAYQDGKTRTDAIQKADAELKQARDDGDEEKVSEAEQKRENLKGMWQGVGAGEKDAPVVVEVFADFSCPHCGAFERAGATEGLQEEIDNGQVRTVFYPVTLSSFEQNGYGNEIAAAGYACAADEGKGEQFAKQAFDKQVEVEAQWDVENVTAIAGDIGMDTGSFENCVKSDRFDEYLKSIDQTMTDRGLTSTPSVVVNGKNVDVNDDGEGLVLAMEDEVANALDGKDKS